MKSAILWKSYIWANRLKGYWQDLDQYQTGRPDLLRKGMAERLLTKIKYFGSRSDALPEWREMARIKDPEDLWREWPNLPILTRQDLQTRFRPELIKEVSGLRGVVSSTGGSTGEPTPYLHDTEMVRATRATRIYSAMKMGWKPGMPVVTVWGSERDIGKQSAFRRRLLSRLANYWLVDGYNMSEQTMSTVLGLVTRLRPVVLTGFTSMLEFVAKKTLSMNLAPPGGCVIAAWNGGEMLFHEQSDLFEKAFGVPILNFYGGRELSAMAYQEKPGAVLKVLRPLLFLEVLDENGQSCPPNQSGRLVWTSTICSGTPFIRYDVGDLGVYDETGVDESGIFAIRELQGRVAGLLRLPDGRKINCLYWNHLFKEFPEVKQFQVVIREKNDIEIRLKGDGFSEERAMYARNCLRNCIDDLPVVFSWVDAIPLTSQGKLIQVIREDDRHPGAL
ncbi:MAG: hypothetical protein M1511_18460 [Deltaproteobacteria bacterium]|nr:hypothetical protein [Deltaproteobacteria bacterium]